MRKTNISTNKIAEICGVSQGTVDRALNNRKGINPETKSRILRVAKEYGYRPNIHASAIAGGKSMLIGVVVFDLNNQYFTDFITLLESKCSPLGYSIVTMFTYKDPKHELECISELYSMSVDGIVFSPINKGKEFESFLHSLKIPIATIGNRLDTIPYFGIDNKSAMYEATKYVLQCGYSKLLYVMPKQDEAHNFSAPSDRLAGFLKAVHEVNVPFSVTDIKNIECKTLKDDTAIICSSDIYAIKLRSLVNNCNAGIIGFDNIDLIDILNLGIDSVSYNTEMTASAVVDYIINNNTDIPEINYKIIKRGSI